MYASRNLLVAHSKELEMAGGKRHGCWPCTHFSLQILKFMPGALESTAVHALKARAQASMIRKPSCCEPVSNCSPSWSTALLTMATDATESPRALPKANNAAAYISTARTPSHDHF